MKQFKKQIGFLVFIAAFLTAASVTAQDGMFAGKPVFAEGTDLG